MTKENQFHFALSWMSMARSCMKYYLYCFFHWRRMSDAHSYDLIFSSVITFLMLQNEPCSFFLLISSKRCHFFPWWRTSTACEDQAIAPGSNQKNQGFSFNLTHKSFNAPKIALRSESFFTLLNSLKCRWSPMELSPFLSVSVREKKHFMKCRDREWRVYEGSLPHNFSKINILFIYNIIRRTINTFKSSIGSKKIQRRFNSSRNVQRFNAQKIM